MASYTPPPTRTEIDEMIAEIHTANPDLAAALKVGHKITRDIEDRLARFGTISDKQLALVFKIQQQARERAAEELTRVPVPNDRVAVRGRVLSTKYQWNDYVQAEMLKMLMLVTTDEGGTYRVFGSVPKAMLDDIQDRGEELRRHWFNKTSAYEVAHNQPVSDEPPPNPNLKGATVAFDARLVQSDDDPYFGFFSRPTKAEVVSWLEEGSTIK